MKEIEKEFLIYDLPTIAEYCSWNWLQAIISWYYENRTNRKLKRYWERKRIQKLFTPP